MNHIIWKFLMYRKAPAKLRFGAKVCVSNLHRFSDWDWTLSFFPTAIYFVSACGKCNLLLFKILKKELSKKLSRLNDNLMKDLVSANFVGNKPCRKREMQGLWHFVATWESPDAAGSPGVCALLWLLNSRRAYPCIAGTQRPQPWTWESVVSKCLVTLLARVNFIEIFLSSPLLFSSNWCFIKKYFFFLLDTLIQKCFSGGVETFVILGQSMVWPTDGGGFALKGKMTDCPCH